MKTNNVYPYSEISTFEDFRIEKERLIRKKKILEVTLHTSYLQIIKIFSISNLLFTSAKEFILPIISDLLGVLLKKTETDIPS